MPRCIIFTRPDGGITIVHPAPQWRKPGEPEDQWLGRVRERSVPKDAKDVRIVELAAAKAAQARARPDT